MKATNPEDLKQCCLSARVTAAPALGGMKMYQVKIACKGKSTSMYKTKEDFKNVINMFKLVGAMTRSKGNQSCCQVCSECNVMTMVRCCDEESLNDFLSKVLDKLRKSSLEAIQKCSTHRGVIQILMDFLSVRNGKYFCDFETSSDEAADPAASSLQDNDHPIEHCSLTRSLSQQFAAFDSVC